ncbi:retinoid-inducible serine carboxypeptidase [Drosophila sulfurigaster albostrigata]|uniref:retinoid-inducible serine carboxypeptidase n=1 Tax=Drosophila sulfurigaster albostrigata TaxID=89887 RepID=UPI002D21EA0A|nr:retinoid-inducible serine carboxypeptidase [Drosophila sulfurigaster albostrigata]
MSRLLTVFLALFAIAIAGGFGAVNAREGYGPGDQDWGFVDVRTGAHMFYWLYYTTANVTSYTQRPLAIWLQGGPGASSTGYGNFEELGPLTLEGVPREWTWVKDMNVLFIDNPVGSGFSYVDSSAYYTTTNKEIALDLVEFMKGFYALHPEFKTVPLHIFCESYGGKMSPEFALELYYAIERKEIECNLKSVALGDPWTSPIDSVLAWAPFLLQMGIVDQNGHDSIESAALRTKNYVDRGLWTLATMQWSLTQSVVLRESKGVDFYNVETPTRGDAYSRQMALLTPEERMIRTLVHFDIDENRDQMLSDLMTGPVTAALNITTGVGWGAQSGATFSAQMGDFMKPVVHIVEELLNNTTLKVGVFSGGLDLICATPGTVNFIADMQWINRTEYLATPRVGINVDGVLEGYEKTAGNFSMFWINRSGHMVPADNPQAMSHILRYYTNYG